MQSFLIKTIQEVRDIRHEILAAANSAYIRLQDIEERLCEQDLKDKLTEKEKN